tara:strand:- start:119501 stop:119770 length:270 start_codon:yes stop_codon:yes gene_type:complete
MHIRAERSEQETVRAISLRIQKVSIMGIFQNQKPSMAQDMVKIFLKLMINLIQDVFGFVGSNTGTGAGVINLIPRAGGNVCDGLAYIFS